MRLRVKYAQGVGLVGVSCVETVLQPSACPPLTSHSLLCPFVSFCPFLGCICSCIPELTLYIAAHSLRLM